MEEPEPEEPWTANNDMEAWPPAPIEEPVKKRKKRERKKKEPREPVQTEISDLYRDEFYAIRAREEEYSLRRAGKKGKRKHQVRMPDMPVMIRSAERVIQDVDRNDHSLYLRLRACLIVTVVNILLAVYNGIGLHWIGGFENVAALSVISLLLLAVAAGVAYTTLRTGFRQFRRGNFGVESVAVLLCVLAIPETVFAIRAFAAAEAEEAAMTQHLPLCALSSLVILCIFWAGDCKAQALRRSAQTMTEAGLDAQDVGRVEHAWHEGPAAVVISDERRILEGMLDTEDPQKKTASRFVPAAVLVTLILSAVAAIVARIDFFRLWTAMLALSLPLGGILSFALPFRLVAYRMSKTRTVLGGWAGARLLRKCRAMFIDDAMLFPGQSLKLSGVKVFGNFDSVQVMQYAAAILQQVDCHVVDRLAMFDDVLPPVQAMRCYDEGGFGGEIGPDSVLVGTWRFMQKMGVHMEDGTRIRHAVYVSVRGELAGLLALRYEAAPKVREALEKLSGPGTALPVLTGSAVLITGGMLRTRFKLPLKNLASPPLRERMELARRTEDGAMPCALLGRPSLESYSNAMRGARMLTGCTLVCLVLAALAALSGVGLAFYYALTGSFPEISCAKMLLFAAAWAVLSGLAMLPALKK